MKKIMGLVLTVVMILSMVSGCTSTSDEPKTDGDKAATETTDTTDTAADTSKDKETASDEEGSVYFLNFKPEIEAVWQEIAEKYTADTGVDVKVVTAAAGTYEETLRAEIAKSGAPTLFQINGPVGYESWKDYTLDLRDTDLFSWLLDPSIVVKGEDNGIYGIPYVVEGYGIIYNNAIMDKYFASASKSTTYTSVDEVNNYDKLKEVVEDMTAIKDELGIEGVFASTSFASGEDWRWQTHLANLPIYYEFKDKAISDADEIDFSYSDGYKNIFDLYINNSKTKPTLLSSKTVNDSMSEFALGQVAMVQNGNWGWGQISGVEGNVVNAEDVKFMPIYIGAEGEENIGLCTGTENFFCINSQTTEANQKASIAFVEWLFSSEEGKNYVTNEFGFIAPFSTFESDEKPTDPLAQEVIRYMADSSKESVSWNFTAFPSQNFKNELGYALLEYAQGSGEWAGVESAFKDGWATEKAATK